MAKKTWVKAQRQAVSTAKATDKVIRANPYRSLGVALGIGALVGYAVSRRYRTQKAVSE